MVYLLLIAQSEVIFRMKESNVFNKLLLYALFSIEKIEYKN